MYDININFFIGLINYLCNENDANFCVPPLPLNMRQLLLAFGCPSPPVTVDVISEHSQ